MITKFKIYESINEGSPQINDWVICEYELDLPYNDVNSEKYKI